MFSCGLPVPEMMRMRDELTSVVGDSFEALHPLFALPFRPALDDHLPALVQDLKSVV